MTRFAGRELPRAPPAQSRTSGLPAYGLYGAYFVKGGAHRFSPRLVLFILLFDPRREHSSAPTAKSHSRRAQGLSRLAASSRPPEGPGLDWPEHGGTLDRLGAGGCWKLRWAGG